MTGLLGFTDESLFNRIWSIYKITLNPMPEKFIPDHSSEDATQPLPLPIETSLSMFSSDMKWQHSGSDGFWVKSLYENENARQKTWLMKIDPGAWSPAHAHEELEQIYVLDGSFFDDDNTYNTGDYVIRSPGAMHTAGSKEGATVLLIYSKTV